MSIDVANENPLKRKTMETTTDGPRACPKLPTTPQDQIKKQFLEAMEGRVEGKDGEETRVIIALVKKGQGWGHCDGNNLCPGWDERSTEKRAPINRRNPSAQEIEEAKI